MFKIYLLDAIPGLIRDLDQLDPDRRLNCILEQAHIANLLPPDIKFDQAYRLFQVYKSNIWALKSYKPRVCSTRITLFRASETPDNVVADPTLGWGELCEGKVDTHVVSGSHYTLLTKPQVQVLADRLWAMLDSPRGSLS